MSAHSGSIKQDTYSWKLAYIPGVSWLAIEFLTYCVACNHYSVLRSWTWPLSCPMTEAWKAQRQRWNREGYCARQVCGAKHAHLWNSANGLLYCERCANLIAEGGLVTFTQENPDDRQTS
jgi:hypothetical protein